MLTKSLLISIIVIIESSFDIFTNYQVVSRWWSQFMTLPWPDTLARYLAVYLPGTDKKSRYRVSGVT